MEEEIKLDFLLWVFEFLILVMDVILVLSVEVVVIEFLVNFCLVCCIVLLFDFFVWFLIVLEDFVILVFIFNLVVEFLFLLFIVDLYSIIGLLFLNFIDEGNDLENGVDLLLLWLLLGVFFCVIVVVVVVGILDEYLDRFWRLMLVFCKVMWWVKRFWVLRKFIVWVICLKNIVRIMVYEGL